MKVKLGDICTFQSGGTPSKGTEEYFNGTIPWITTTALNGGKIDETKAVDWITEKAIEKSAAKLVPAFSIMVGTRVGVGKVAVNAVQMSTSQDIISLLNIDENRWSKDYLCKYIQGKNTFLNSQARGATIKGIKIDVLANLELEEIPLKEQVRISETIDKVKEILDARKSELLELDKLVKARFIELFSKENGWPLVKLEKLCNSIVRGPFGSALKVNFFVEKGPDTVKVYEQKNAIQRSAVLGDSYVTKAKYQELKRFECGPGDFIMSCSGTIGCLYQLPNDAELGIINQALCKFHLNEKMLPEVFLTYMKNSADQIETKGSGIKNIGAVSYIKNMEIALPPLHEQEQFAAFVRQSDKSKSAVQKSLDETQVLFDSLMQKYFG